MSRRGFTLLEIVLAIGLSGAVLALLATAIDLYMVRVDSSRTQVESAQLARTLLNQIADDLCAARYYTPSLASESDTESSGTSGTSGTSESADPTLVQGIFGTATELRIDRSAYWRWESVVQQMNIENRDTTIVSAPLQQNMPQTVRYLFGDGNELLAAELAKQGVSEEPLASGHAGLFREQVSTVSWMNEGSAQASNLTGTDVGNAELIAPEVVEIKFTYFDGAQLLDEWDSSLTGELPKAVEIEMTLLEEPLETAAKRTRNQLNEFRQRRENLVVYRRFVRLPSVSQPQEAIFPQTQQQQQQQQPSQQPGGQPGS